MAEDRVQLLPDPDQRELLTATLERVNRASNAARATALSTQTFDVASLRPIVAAEAERAKLPATFNRLITERVAAALVRRAGKPAKFSTYQSLTLPAGVLKWPATDRVTIPTASGKRTVRVRVDSIRGHLRPPLEGRPSTLVFANGEFEIVAAD